MNMMSMCTVYDIPFDINLYSMEHSNCELLKWLIRHGCPKRLLSAHVARVKPANCCFKLINFVFISNSSGNSNSGSRKSNNNNHDNSSNNINDDSNENREKAFVFNFMFSFAIIFTLFANLRTVVSYKAIFAPD